MLALVVWLFWLQVDAKVGCVGGLSSLWVVLEVCNAEVGCWYWNSFLYRKWLQVDTSVIARSCC